MNTKLLIFALTATLLGTLLCQAGPPAHNDEHAVRTALLTEFYQLSQSMKYIPPLMKTQLDDPKNDNNRERIRNLARKADLLPLHLLQSNSAQERTLACVVFGYSDRLDAIPLIEKLAKDEAEALPIFDRLQLTGPIMIVDGKVKYETVTKKRQVRDWAVASLSRTLGISLDTGDREDLLTLYSQIKKPELLPSWWAYRYRRNAAWGDSIDGIKQEILKLPAPDRALIAVAIDYTWQQSDRYSAKRIPIMFTQPEIIELIKKDFDQDSLRKFLTNKVTSPDRDLFDTGVNNGGFVELKFFVLENAAALLSKDDVDWLLEMVKRPDDIDELEAAYLFAAYILDPQRVGPIFDTIENLNNNKQIGRIQHGLNLYQRLGTKSVPTLVDMFYGIAWKPTDPKKLLAFQDEFLTAFAEWAEGEETKLTPLLRGLVAHEQFTRLGWHLTRRFGGWRAQVVAPNDAVAEREWKRLDKLQHKMAPLDFDIATLANDGQPPAGGDAVLKSVAEFQKLYQRRLLEIEPKPKAVEKK